MPKLTVIILAYNEEQNIEECVKNASFAEDVLVVDSGSTDRTVELAESLGARVVDHPMDEGFAAQRNFALTQTDADWIFYLDADERLTPEAAQEILEIVEKNEPAAYEIKRLNVAFGQLMKHGPMSPDYSLRLYPRTAVQWEGAVHEHANITVPLHQMKNVMRHYTYNSWKSYFDKFNRYTSINAENLKKRGKKASAGTVLSHAFFAFIKAYIMKQGFREGFLGFIMSLMAAYADLVKYLKLKYGS